MLVLMDKSISQLCFTATQWALGSVSLTVSVSLYTLMQNMSFSLLAVFTLPGIDLIIWSISLFTVEWTNTFENFCIPL